MSRIHHFDTFLASGIRLNLHPCDNTEAPITKATLEKRATGIWVGRFLDK